MAISKEQWAKIEETLTGILGRVELLCDGYKVNACVEHSKMRLVIAVYVDGYIKGEWLKGEHEIPRKFHQEEKRFLRSVKLRAWYIRQSKLTKLWTKEECAEYAAKAAETMSHWMPWWTNSKAFCRHIRKSCTSIELVNIGY